MNTENTIKTILVIDDEQIIRQSFTDFLEDHEYHVLTAESGSAGLEIVRNTKVDLVLTDLRMPEMDGLEFMKHCKMILPELPIIVVSGAGQVQYVVEALRLGAWDYLVKPVKDLSILGHAVNKTLERARLVAENKKYQENLEELVQERTKELETANQDLESINIRLKKIVDTTAGLSVLANIDDFSARLMREFASHMAASGGSLYLVEEKGLRLKHSIESDHAPEFIPFPLQEKSVFNRVMQLRKPLLIKDMEKIDEMKSSGWQGYQDGSCIVFPFSDVSETILGLIVLHNKAKPPFVIQDQEIGTILASHSYEVLKTLQATEQLKASETRFRSLVQMLPEAIFETDIQLNLTYANQRAYEMFGYTEEELKSGIIGLDLIAPEDRDRAREGIKKRIKGMGLGPIEYKIIKKNGEMIPALFNMSPVINGKELQGFRGIIIDISQRKRAEEEKTELEKQLRKSEKLKTIGTLAGGIAHDFNNILTPIMGYTDMILSNMVPSEPTYQELNHVLNASYRAKELVEQILLFSKQGEKEQKPLRLQSLIKEALKLLRPTIPATIEIRQHIDASCGKVMADATQIHQVIVNLCTNAWQAMETKGGFLTIELKQTDISQRIQKQYPGLIDSEYVCMSVIDTGTGMEKETLERIFEPFYTTKSVDKGTGLGMAVVHGIIQSHNGEIIVDSQIGEGTAIHIYLPISDLEEVQVNEISSTRIDGHEYILLVDDDQNIVELIKKMLMKYGYKVDAYENSITALKAFQDHPSRYDLLISDLTMPRMNGTQLSKLIYQIKPSLPVIIMTGYGDDLDDEIKSTSGILKIVGKPIKPSRLASIIREILDK